MSLLGLVGLTSALFVSADLASNSYALDSTVGIESEVTATVDGTHYVSLTASDVTFSASPTGSTPVTNKQTVNVSVETNVTGGVSLYLASTTNTNALYKDGNPTNSNLPHIAASTATVESPTTLDNLATNTWAYSTDNTNYQGVPTSSDTNSPNLIADINGVTTGTTSGGVTSATIPIYYAAKIDTSIPAGSYASSVTYSAIVDGGIITEATLTKIEIDGSEVDTMQPEVENTLTVTTNLMTNTYGTPRVYLETTSPAGYQECGDVVVGRNDSGYMTITCKVTPTQAATGVTLHIVPKGSSDDRFCTDGTYTPDTSDCEAGEWKWGSFTVGLPDIVEPPEPVLNTITYMQDMTPELCASAPLNDTARLIDKRDGKYYWVAKLADGNCWMTQNLELDLTSGKSLTPELSDVSANWNPGATTFTSAQEGGRGSSYNNTVQSWNLGKYVWKTPNSTSDCLSGTNLSESSCASYWQDASSMTPMTTYRTDGVSVEGNTYDAHYLAGNYYSWEAATAGTGHSHTSDGAEAPDSICPAGWQLPLSRSSNNAVSGSFYNLLNQYGFTSSTGSGANSITRAPLFFVRSGYVYPTYYLVSAGDYGYYWSSVASSSSRAYTLAFASSYVYPSSNYNRCNGQSVRCVAPSA